MRSKQPGRAHGRKLGLIGMAMLASLALAGCIKSTRAASDHFPDVVLVNQDNQRVHFYDDLIRGKLVVINFMFTSCESLCPRTTGNLVKVQNLLGDRLGRDVHMISISVDPANDTPASLKKYTQTFQVKPGWQFVTGSRADIELIRQKLGVYEKDKEKDSDKNQHTGMLIYGNEATGRWNKVYAMSDPGLIVSNITRWSQR